MIRHVVLVGVWLAACAGLVKLGLWQLDRAEIKQQRYTEFTQRMAAPALALDSQMTSPAELERQRWRRVTVSGHYRDFHVLLDNRVLAGSVGYEVLSPFITAAGQTIMVDRGWIPLTVSRQQVPDLIAPADPTTLQGFLGDEPVVGLDFDETAGNAEWMSPRVLRVQRFELEALGALIETKLWPAVLYLDPQALGAYEVKWPLPGDGSARHRAYAVQWFAMAVVLGFIGLWNLRRVWRRVRAAE